MWRTASGCSYVGSFQDNRFVGPGQYRWPGGETHIGEWQEGRPCGPGVRVLPDRTSFKADFTVIPDSQLVAFHRPDGVCVTERWKEGRRTEVSQKQVSEASQEVSCIRVPMSPNREEQRLFGPILMKLIDALGRIGEDVPGGVQMHLGGAVPRRSQDQSEHLQHNVQDPVAPSS